ncbi:MAG TPA: GyrI-like domain-containing protein [Niabella sp.]|nr:GyrI-like domain-containing protein [Niabella sp.]HOZ97410.1 GyrI-like domain-containing protein [Niabella sp.]HQW15222.1 GyrI-like domain-containing protein [Niabella sp.]HQX20310.1 GyrI-like domain-containing protein [Niabella sp.]HQX42304.1 GyrI-like domain-containing protein [Niabella sp.]
MTPEIEIKQEKKLIGKRMQLSLTDYNVAELWKSFMPIRKEIINPITDDMISMSVYYSDYFTNFDPSNKFEKWATLEVADFDHTPIGMETFILPEGLYAIFYYQGLNTDHSIFEYIYGSWLPSSDYVLDDRPHLELLGKGYKNNDPNSEEEIWIPIRLK